MPIVDRDEILNEACLLITVLSPLLTPRNSAQFVQRDVHDRGSGVKQAFRKA
jgi:hypothetical protein